MPTPTPITTILLLLASAIPPPVSSAGTDTGTCLSPSTSQCSCTAPLASSNSFSTCCPASSIHATGTESLAGNPFTYKCGRLGRRRPHLPPLDGPQWRHGSRVRLPVSGQGGVCTTRVGVRVRGGGGGCGSSCGAPRANNLPRPPRLGQQYRPLLPPPNLGAPETTPADPISGNLFCIRSKRAPTTYWAKPPGPQYTWLHLSTLIHSRFRIRAVSKPDGTVLLPEDKLMLSVVQLDAHGREGQQ
ncbi:hypothetical protein BDW74DRAFT_178364 [Aspergillus multicolor]|uniref:uncharacterized protein n=1 Tax=Aspergillus multicolor TaxID=41759 RepID=UPI003CCD95DC